MSAIHVPSTLSEIHGTVRIPLSIQTTGGFVLILAPTLGVGAAPPFHMTAFGDGSVFFLGTPVPPNYAGSLVTLKWRTSIIVSPPVPAGAVAWKAIAQYRPVPGPPIITPVSTLQPFTGLEPLDDEAEMVVIFPALSNANHIVHIEIERDITGGGDSYSTSIGLREAWLEVQV